MKWPPTEKFLAMKRAKNYCNNLTRIRIIRITKQKRITKKNLFQSLT